MNRKKIKLEICIIENHIALWKKCFLNLSFIAAQLGLISSLSSNQSPIFQNTGLISLILKMIERHY
jgi:hypothetical protein